METNAKRYPFTIPIGDWSGDGHGHCDHYSATAAKPIGDVREAYFAAKKKFPSLCPENFCNEYEDSAVPSAVLASLRAAGAPETALSEFESETPDDKRFAFAQIVAWYVNQGDPTVDMRLAPMVKVPMLCGSDRQRRHIGQFGYGLFGA